MGALRLLYAGQARCPRTHSAFTLCGHTVGCRGLAGYRKTALAFFSGGLRSGGMSNPNPQCGEVRPNPSLKRRPATAATV